MRVSSPWVRLALLLSVASCAAGGSNAPSDAGMQLGADSSVHGDGAVEAASDGSADAPGDAVASDGAAGDDVAAEASGLGDAGADGTTGTPEASADAAGAVETGGGDGASLPETSVLPDSASPDGESPDTGACAAGQTRPCTTTCGSTGTQACNGGAWGACAPPAETCNLADDDCDGYCDSILGCRVGVDRSDDATAGLHFYTTNDSEAECCGYSVETFDYYYLYGTQASGTVPFYRCLTSKGAHLYTTDPACEGQTVEGVMGYIATSAVCGATPLYRLYDASSGDYFYTTSQAEATSAASGGGYVMETSPGYVWSADCGGPNCTWPSPIAMTPSTRTAKTGFPTAWFGYPIDGTQSLSSLVGTVSVTNTANIFSEVLFILQYLPSGTCTSGIWPASTPEYGPPGAAGIGNFIVKAPTTGTFTVNVNLTLPGGLPITGCVLLGLNGGTVAASHDVVSAASLTLSYTAPQTPAQSAIGVGGEMCFGMSGGCQLATTNDSQSFASVTPITQAMHLVALYGDISDSTFDGSSTFGPPPAGAWTASNDFYVYHGADCTTGLASGLNGPGSYYASIPATATHLLSVPEMGNQISVSEGQVFQSFASMPVALSAGDCLVTLWGLSGGGAFDNETQVTALVGP